MARIKASLPELSELIMDVGQDEAELVIEDSTAALLVGRTYEGRKIEPSDIVYENDPTTEAAELQQVCSVPGSTVVLEPRRYFIDRTIELAEGVSLIGTPRETQLVNAPDFIGSTLHISSNHVNVTGVDHHGNQLARPEAIYESDPRSHLIRIDDAINVKIEDCHFDESIYDSIYIGTLEPVPSVGQLRLGCDGVQIINCHTRNSKRQGFTVVVGRNIHFLNCSAYYSGPDNIDKTTSGIDVELNLRELVENLTIENFIAHYNSGNGIRIGVPANGSVVRNIHILGGDFAYNAKHGIRVDRVNSRTEEPIIVEQVLVESAVCKFNEQSGIKFDRVDNATVLETECENNYGRGVLAVDSKYVVIDRTTAKQNGQGDILARRIDDISVLDCVTSMTVDVALSHPIRLERNIVE